MSKFYQKVFGLADFFPLFGHARESNLLNRGCFIFRLTLNEGSVHFHFFIVPGDGFSEVQLYTSRIYKKAQTSVFKVSKKWAKAFSGFCKSF